MTPVASSLRILLVGAYPAVVRRRLATRGTNPPPGLEGALAEGTAWLDAALGDLLERPYREQRRGPLEVFQEAMRFPTEVLAAAGVEAPDRDPVAAGALPGDSYDLAPASSRDLGEEVWAAHLRWGAEKAAGMADPPSGDGSDR